MRWVTNAEEAAYMRGRQKQNRNVYSAAENWMAAKLKQTPYKFKRQAMWGYRLFDFWCHEIGIAVEVDGPEHKGDYDHYRDTYNWARSALLVIRVRNFNENDAAFALRQIASSLTYKERKALVKPGKKLVREFGMDMARSPTVRRRNGRDSSLAGASTGSLGSVLDSVSS